MGNGNLDFDAMIKMAEMRRDEPEKYKEFLEHYKEVSKDIVKMTVELAKEMEDI